MEYEKVQQRINDMVGDNVRKLAQLFPSTVKDGEVDFEALKEELGQFTEVDSEKYELTWAGKRDAKKIAQEDIVGKTLKFIPEDSKNADTTENLYIEGDNLEVLKLLRQNYYGAIKMIYIDPPYNTGNDFVYNDSFGMNKEDSDMAEGSISEQGEMLFLNTKSHNRYHANWLNMIYPRLKISKDLLRDDGVIFISIDNHEIDNLLKVCDEIFGDENRVGCVANINNPKGRSDEKNMATAHEYLVVYQKSDTNLFGFEPEENVLKRYNKEDEKGKYRYIDLRKTGDSDRREDRPKMYYYFLYNERNKEFYPTFNEDIPEEYIQIKPLKDDGSDGRWRVGIDTAVERLINLVPTYMSIKKRWTVMEKDYLSNDARVKATTAWTYKDVNSERGTEQFIELGFKKEDFTRPKPIGTIMRTITLATQKDDIILDFFSGSATTAHALFQINVTEKANRKFILIQVDEMDKRKNDKKTQSSITEIGKERIRRAGEKIKQENPDANIDIGFKVFRVADTNIKWNSLMNAGQLDMAQIENTPDLIDFMPNSNDVDIVYELILRQRDVPLSETLEQLSDIGTRTYLYASSYLVCLETEITEEIVNNLAEIDPLPIKFIFRDSAFKDDIALKDETFRRLKALISKNAGTDKFTYTVEFI